MSQLLQNTQQETVGDVTHILLANLSTIADEIAHRHLSKKLQTCCLIGFQKVDYKYVVNTF